MKEIFKHFLMIIKTKLVDKIYKRVPIHGSPKFTYEVLILSDSSEQKLYNLKKELIDLFCKVPNLDHENDQYILDIINEL